MARKPKICFVTPFFYPVIGGVETHILELGKELIKKGYEIYVVTSNSDRFGEVKNKKKENYQGINIVRCNTLFRISFGEILFPGAIKEIRNINPDIIHIHGYRHWYNLIPFLINKPCFITPHWPDYRGQRSKIIQTLADLIDISIGKRLWNANKKICTVTEDEKKWINSFGINYKKMVTTPNALPVEYFKTTKNTRFREKYKLDNKVVILTVSRIHKSKGIDQIVKAAKLMPESIFVILGKDGGEKKNLENMAKKIRANNVIFGGEVTEKEKIEAYLGADIYCQASHFEAFGISILEAMSQGLPCVVAEKGGMPWVVGKTGLTFEEENITDLKSKLMSLVKDKSFRKELGKKAKVRASLFSWYKTASILDKEYKRYIYGGNKRK